MPIIKIVPMPGPSGSGGNADTADFVFATDGDQSTMTISNHDMRIETTRDDGQDADIDINSADDVWITAFDSVEITSTDDEVRIITGQGGQHQWSFTSIGTIELPTTNSSINSGVDGDIIVDTRSATFSNNYQDASIGLQTNTAVVLTVNEDTSWFASYTPDSSNSATITFADSTTVQTVAVYDATSQGTAGVVFQWADNLTKTFEETYPLTITGNTYDPNNYVGIRANGAIWEFASDGEIKFPSSQPSNNRTGTGEVLQFGNPTQQSIITGSKPTSDNPTAQRLVVAGQDGYDVGTGNGSEGGDVYLWAGQGGGQYGSGGDIKVDAGQGSVGGGGGTVKVRGGYSENSTGGFVDIYAGDSSMGSGGNISIAAGSNYSVSEAVGGTVSIYGGGSADANSGGSIVLATYQNGKIILSGEGGEFLNDSSDPGNQIATIDNVASLIPEEVGFAVVGGTTGTQPTFEGDPLFVGSYVKNGPLVHFQIQVDMTNITSFGTGQYFVELPFASKYGTNVRTGCLHDFNTGNEWNISGHVVANSNVLELHYTSGTGQDEAFDYNSPINLTTADNFHISGTFIAV